ncbi:MAG TPA: hypothetical protein VEK39_01895 [Solirubrobacterales bacterium]|nr:hypothetical protein [Solirubrobacterales bacterium]
MAILTLEAIGPKAEQLANDAGEALDIPVGYDPEFECATFDSDTQDEDELQAIVFEALARIDSEWQAHLRLLAD